jgi:hypothetical protein
MEGREICPLSISVSAALRNEIKEVNKYKDEKKEKNRKLRNHTS